MSDQGQRTGGAAALSAVVAAWFLWAPSTARCALRFEEAAPEQAAPAPPQQPPQPAAGPRRSPRPTAPAQREPPDEQAAPAAEHPAAQPGVPGFFFDPRSRCRVWIWDPQPGETASWNGPSCRGGVASGDGEVLRQINGRIMSMQRGAFAEGRLTGQGARSSPDGSWLEAQFVDGRANGRGVLMLRDGGRYEGLFRDDFPHGRGVRLWPTGARYEGEWADGRRSGRGSQIEADGARYEGMWSNDRPDGIGSMLYANGDSYDGGWRNGQRHGRGTFRWFGPGRSGVHQGEWRNDRRHGFGTETFLPENARYEGTYVDGRPQGRGVYTIGDRDQYEGEVSDGCLRTRWRAVRIGSAGADCR